MKKLKNKILSIILSAGIVSASSVAISTKASGLNINLNYEVSHRDMERLTPSALAFTLATTVAIGVITFTTWLLSEYNTNSRLERETFGDNLKDNIYTEKQKNINWSFIACLQGLYKMRGYNNISQNEIYQKLFGTYPQDSRGYNCFKNIAYVPDRPFVHSVNNILPGLNLTQVVINTNKSLIGYSSYDNNRIYQLMNKLKEIYRRCNRFAIVDSFRGYTKINEYNIINYSNVINISGDYITLENSVTGKTRTESLYNFCKRYYEPNVTGILDLYNSIRIFYLTNNYSSGSSVEEYNLYN